MEFEKIFTDRLILRKLTPEDYQFIFENFPKQKIQEELGLHSDEEFLKEKQKFEQGYSMYNRSLVHFQLIEKNSNIILGGAGFHNWNPVHFRAELGYHLHLEESKRKGFMTEAVKPILEYGFQKMNLNRIEACTGPENVASLKILQKFGFKQEGYLRQHYHWKDQIFDSLIFSLLKTEFETKNSTGKGMM